MDTLTLTLALALGAVVPPLIFFALAYREAAAAHLRTLQESGDITLRLAQLCIAVEFEARTEGVTAELYGALMDAKGRVRDAGAATLPDAPDGDNVVPFGPTAA